MRLAKEVAMANRNSRPWVGFGIAFVTLMASVIGITLLLETQELGMTVRVLLALVPPIVWVFCMIFILQMLRSQDEFQQRIHLEALAVAFPSLLVAIVLCEYLRKAGLYTSFKPDHVMVMMMALLGIGYFVAWRRYR
jgi:uncharacterized membrane-anchored protein